MDAIGVIDDAVRAKVFQMFDRSQKSANEDVLIVKEWLKTQLHLPEIMDERKIMNFLIMNKFSIEKAKQNIDMYYTMRSITPEFFQGFDPKSDKLAHFLKSALCCIHPKAVDQMYRVFFLKNRFKDEFDMVPLMLQSVNIAEIRLFEDVAVGEVIVLDLEQISIYDMRKLTPTLVAKILTVYEKVFSLRLRGMYLVNCPSYANMLVALLRQFLKPKLFERVHVDSGFESLRQLFGQEDLPEDYGGEGPSLQQLQDLTVEKLNQYSDWFQNVHKLKIKEELRPAKLNNDEILGFHGTFKKLDLD